MKRYPVGLTIATTFAVAILLGLGTWQLQRLEWKRDLIARIEASGDASPISLSTALDLAGRSENLTYVRARVRCERVRGTASSYSLDEGQIAWRALARCDTSDGPILVERGVIEAGLGRVSPPEVSRLPAPGEIVGVLRALGSGEVRKMAQARGWNDLLQNERCLDAESRCFPFYLSAEIETPGVPGLRPAPLRPPLSNNHLGYAITWYGLAAALIGVYVALLRKRLKS